jgi:hypothetical protein
MIKRIKDILKEKIQAKATGREITLFEDDIFIVSYPKSGNTWMRFLLGNLISGNFNFNNMDRIIPDIYNVNNTKLATIERPRILKSHEYFHPGYKKVIYIIRDPRSVAISYFHYLQKVNKIQSDLPFQNYLIHFIRGGYDSYGTWKENVESWLAARQDDPDSFILTKYENLVNDTYFEFKQIVDFIGIEAKESELRNAIEKSSFSRMKANEKITKDNAEEFKKTDLSKPFVRAGRTDEWKEAMSDQDLDLINRHFGNTMKKFGYK